MHNINTEKPLHLLSTSRYRDKPTQIFLEQLITKISNPSIQSLPYLLIIKLLIYALIILLTFKLYYFATVVSVFVVSTGSIRYIPSPAPLP